MSSDAELVEAARRGDAASLGLLLERYQARPYITLSPLALYQIRAGLGITRSFGGLRPKDIAAQRRLRTTFLADWAEEALRPKTEKSVQLNNGKP